MRIAHLANFYGPTSGGLRTAMHALGAGYLAKGHDVLLVVPGAKDSEEVTAYGRRVTIASPVVPFTGGYRVIVRTAKVRKVLQEFAPDTLEVSDRATLRNFGAWASSMGIPAVFFSHERADGVLRSNAPRFMANWRVLGRMADWHNRGTSRRFTTVVCTTGYAVTEFTRASLPTVTIPLGVDLDAFHPRYFSQSVRAEFADADTTLLVMASRLSKEKRPELAIDAARLLAERGLKVRLVSAGTGALDAAMRRRAEGGPVTFLGFVAERERFAGLLASADVVIAPGPIETFGLAALEALASGTPTVVNAASALPEVVGNGGVAAEGTAESFADAVEQILAVDPARRRQAARERAEEMPWAATVTKMLALHAQNLSELAEKTTRPTP